MAGAQAGVLPGDPRAGAPAASPRARAARRRSRRSSVVNGPIRNEIGMNSGIGAMGPYNHANATIGRAYGLLSQNLQGGSVPGETYMGSQGNWLRLQRDLRRERGAQPVGSRSTCSRASSRPTARSASSSAAGTRMSGYGPRATLAGEDSPLRCAACDQYMPPILVLDPIVARLVRRARLRHQGEADRLAAPRTRCCRRANTGTTSGCRR